MGRVIVPVRAVDHVANLWRCCQCGETSGPTTLHDALHGAGAHTEATGHPTELAAVDEDH